MASPFETIPTVAVEYVRSVFAAANDKATSAVSVHPSMYEETLDHILIMELSASPPAFFAAEQVGISIESHWLGARWMFGRWEIADIAVFVLLRRRGNLIARKVALLQTKRLYSQEIPAVALDEADYQIGIGRLADRTDRSVPISSQRTFGFDRSSVYDAMRAGAPQVDRIDAYTEQRGIPVYYGLYHPLTLPFQSAYPPIDGRPPDCENIIGCRVLTAEHIHSVLRKCHDGQAPSVDNVAMPLPIDPTDPNSAIGWRLERFVADEVLRCREGQIFQDLTDPKLQALLYGRTAPIAAAIAIKIDVGGEGYADG